MIISLTGSTGFLGRSILKCLEGGTNTVIKNKENLVNNVPSIPYSDLVIHAAGKAHAVPKSITEEQVFYDVNVKGTKNLLKGIENVTKQPRYFIFISSVSVYGLETGNLINEDTPLLAEDAYGKSKIEAEKIVQDWCTQKNVICTILRLPLLAGPNPPGNLGAMITGIQKGYYFNVDGGKAKKSMVLVEDIAKIIPVVAKVGGIYNLTDRYHPSFYELSYLIATQLHQYKPASIPLFVAKLMGAAGDLIGNKAPINSKKLNKILSDLTFDDSKAVKAFGWDPISVLEGFKIEQP